MRDIINIITETVVNKDGKFEFIKELNENSTNTQLFINAFKQRKNQLGLPDVDASISSDPRNNKCELSSIWNHGNTGRGDATKVMKLLVSLADEYGITLTGYVHYLRYDDDTSTDEEFARNDTYLNSKQLINWYKKLGFRIVGGDEENPYVERTPALNEKAPPGKKAKHFIKHREADFKERYGDAWKEVLYATANKLFHKKKK